MCLRAAAVGPMPDALLSYVFPPPPLVAPPPPPPAIEAEGEGEGEGELIAGNGMGGVALNGKEVEASRST